MERPKMSVGSDFLRFTFLQLVPGSEKDIHGSVPVGMQLFYCPSDFDAIACSKIDDFPSDSWMNSIEHAGVRSRYDVLCFSWAHSFECLAADCHTLIEDAYAANGVIGLFLGKINTQLLNRLGMKAEEVIASFVDNLIGQTPAWAARYKHASGILGTYGYWEVALLVAALEEEKDTIGHLLEFMTSVRRLNYRFEQTGIELGLSPSAEGSNVFEQTHIIPCISPQEGDNWRLADRYGEVVAWTSVTTLPGHALRVHGRAEELGFSARAVSGDSAIWLHTSSKAQSGSGMGLGTLMEKIMALRKLRCCDHAEGEPFSNVTLATSTCVELSEGSTGCAEHRDSSSMFIELEMPPHRDRPSPTKWKEFDDAGLRTITAFQKEFEKNLDNSLLCQSSSLAGMVLLFQAAYADSTSYDAIRDMLPFFAKTLKVVNDIRQQAKGNARVTSEIRKRYVQLEALTELFMAGYRQRMTGVSFSPATSVGQSLDLQGGGVHRIIAAANAIPRSILADIADASGNKNLAWTGFCLFGHRPGTCRLDNGVMNLPSNITFQPEEWWRLAHETGHEYSDLLNLPNLPDILKLTTVYADEILGDSRIEENLLRAETIISEVFANVFELEMGFMGNWDLYMKSVWRFLDDYLEGELDPARVDDLVLRSLFAAIHNLESLGVISKERSLGYYEQLGSKGPWLDLDPDLSDSLVANRFYEGGGVLGLLDEMVVRITSGPSPAGPILRSWSNSLDRKKVARRYTILEPVRPTLHDLVREPAEKIARKHEILRGSPHYLSQLERYGRVLTDGEVLVSPDIRPLDIVLALQHAKQTRPKSMSLRARTAAILSLWNQEVTGLSCHASLEDHLADVFKLHAS